MWRSQVRTAIRVPATRKVLATQKISINLKSTILKRRISEKEIRMMVQIEVAFRTSVASALRLVCRLDPYRLSIAKTSLHSHTRITKATKFCSLIFRARNAAKDCKPSVNRTGRVAAENDKTSNTTSTNWKE